MVDRHDLLYLTLDKDSLSWKANSNALPNGYKPCPFPNIQYTCRSEIQHHRIEADADWRTYHSERHCCNNDVVICSTPLPLDVGTLFVT